MSEELESVFRNVPKKKSSGPDFFIDEFYQTLKEELMSIILNYSQLFSIKNVERERTLPNSFLRPTLP